MRSGFLLLLLSTLIGLSGCASERGIRAAVIDLQSKGFPYYEEIDWEPAGSVHVYPPKGEASWARIERTMKPGTWWTLKWSHSSKPYEEGGPVPHGALMRAVGLRDGQQPTLRIKLLDKSDEDLNPIMKVVEFERGGTVSLQLEADGGISETMPGGH